MTLPFGRSAGPRPADGDEVEVAGVRVRLRVSPRARRIALRLDPRERLFIATAPSARRLPDALAFARTREDWMRAALEGAPVGTRLRPGLVLPLEGAPCRLERAAMRIRPTFHPAREGEPARLVASGEDAAFGRACVRALKARALERAVELSNRHMERLRLSETAEVAVADARSRWGSCRGAGRGRPAALRYNWRLILAPPEVFDYVAAHEVAHLIEANHSKAFWAIVEDLHPALAAQRRWLRLNGRSLHAYAP